MCKEYTENVELVKMLIYTLECLSQGADLQGEEIGRTTMMQLCSDVLDDVAELKRGLEKV